MRFKELAKGTRAVKEVQFRLANAPPITLQPGEPLPSDEYTAKLGVRVLTGDEIATVYSKAQAAAKAAGQHEWLSEHPLCRLHEMVQTLLAACVDIEAPAEPFFASAEEILRSPEIGGDNIAYLFEQHGAWQDECSIRTGDLTVEQVIGLLAVEADRPENAESPLVRMRPSSRESFLRITASLFSNLLKDRLLSGSGADTASSETAKTTESAPRNETTSESSAVDEDAGSDG